MEQHSSALQALGNWRQARLRVAPVRRVCKGSSVQLQRLAARPQNLTNINRGAVPYAMAMHLSYACVSAKQLQLQCTIGATALYVSVAV